VQLFEIIESLMIDSTLVSWQFSCWA